MNAWAYIRTIAKRELGAYFSSPLAYVFIVIFLLLCGFFTFMVGGFFERVAASRSADYAKALHDARLVVRSQQQWASPYYWAPFVLIGPPQ